MATALHSALRLLFPPQCVHCDSRLEEDFALCGHCWSKTPFVSGLVCNLCGTPLPGDDANALEHCDDCLTIARPWSKGRSALLYREDGRDLVLALKHGDRPELARAAARWMAQTGRLLMAPGCMLVPVPVHWSRLLRRRYNQAALLARALSEETGHAWLPDSLIRTRRTAMLDGMSRDERFAMLTDAIRPHPKRGAAMTGKNVVLIDDVMTTGATLAAAADACRAAGAADVYVLVLARVAKDD